jgi:N-acetylmuramoyl-L-alanine amidase
MKTVPHRMKAVASMAALIVCVSVLADVRPAAAGQSAQSIYTRALGRERDVRDAAAQSTLAQLRAVVRSYESVVRRFPASGYCDNALWQGANLAVLAFDRFGQTSDRRTAIRLLTQLKEQYPSSSLVARSTDAIKELEARAEPPASPSATADPVLPSPPEIEARDIRPPDVAAKAAVQKDEQARDAAPKDAAGVVIRDIKRTLLPDGVRVTVEMDGESLYRTERLENPRRVFFDLKGARAAPGLQDATLKFTDDVVREIRLGRHPQQTTRIVMDMESVDSYSVFALYNPYRLVVDFKRSAAASASAAKAPAVPPAPVPASLSAPLPGRSTSVEPPRVPVPAETKTVPAAREPVPQITRPSPPELISPAAPAANANGQFSLARQLGLGISRIVLDAGHGGHDPGAQSNGLNEAELVLDVALRLRQLLEKQPGVEVVMTRDTDVFIPLEERTAIANRNGADLFLSIHANASRNPRARGIETYFLNFASNPEAEAVAARENSASGRTMHSLPEIVRAIALNNKIDESRDFADMVQKSMVRRLAARNKLVKDLGVKQAPFVVLIGAGMPSVLAEISFVTNQQERGLLKTGAYRQQIAESLLDAIQRYQRSLKGVKAVAARE